MFSIKKNKVRVCFMKLKSGVIGVLVTGLTVFSINLTSSKIKAAITVPNPKTDYVVKTTSNVYKSNGKRTSFKTRGQIQTGNVPVIESQLYEGKFINVQETKTINGTAYYKIGPNAYIKQNNVLNYAQEKAKLEAYQAQDDVNDDSDQSTELSSDDVNFDIAWYDNINEDPSPAMFDDSGYHNRVIKNARKLLGYFTYGTGAYRTNFGSWRHPNKNGSTDCSGFVWIVMKRAGYRVGNVPFFTLPMERDAKSTHGYLKKISAKNIRPGDIVIVNTGNGVGQNGHAAIVDGKYDGWDTQIIEEGGNLGVDDVHRSSLGSSLSDKLAKGRITYARPVK